MKKTIGLRTYVYLGLGSNLNNPKKQLALALCNLNYLPNTTLQACSSFYNNHAISNIPQPNYLNAAVRLQTSLTPLHLLYQLQNIEQRMGRLQTKRWGARIIDIDILLYGHLQLNFEILTIPHLHLYQRPFVLKPLAEIYTPNTASFNTNKVQTSSLIAMH